MQQPAPPAALEIGGRAYYTLRQLDGWLGAPKGIAFRAFKRCRDRFREGSDFLRLDAVDDAGRIAALRERELVYPASVHVVLIADTAVARIAEASYMQNNS